MTQNNNIKTFLVGGAVRDMLIGRDSNDLDFCVVGATPADMIDAGFEQVGKGFPVFLHPVTKDEHALARKEQSVGDGHCDFEFVFDKSVALEDDLLRRDLTINAIAFDSDSSKFIDPFGGRLDIERKLLRHVSDAFGEDPLRVIRVARFAATLGFNVSNDTMDLMTTMASNGMLDNLTMEVVMKEMMKALKSDKPSTFFRVLNTCGALEVVFPEIFALVGQTQPVKFHPEGDAFEHTMDVIDRLAGNSAKIVFAGLVHDLGKGLTPKSDLPKHHGHEKAGVPVVSSFCDRIKATKDIKQFSLRVTGLHGKFRLWKQLRPSTKIKFFKSLGCNDLDNLNDFVTAFCGDHPSFSGSGIVDIFVNDWIVLQDVKRTAAADAIALGLKGKKIGDFIKRASINAI